MVLVLYLIFISIHYLRYLAFILTNHANIIDFNNSKKNQEFFNHNLS